MLRTTIPVPQNRLLFIHQKRLVSNSNDQMKQIKTTNNINNSNKLRTSARITFNAYYISAHLYDNLRWYFGAWNDVRYA